MSLAVSARSGTRSSVPIVRWYVRRMWEFYSRSVLVGQCDQAHHFRPLSTTTSILDQGADEAATTKDAASMTEPRRSVAEETAEQAGESQRKQASLRGGSHGESRLRPSVLCSGLSAAASGQAAGRNQSSELLASSC